MNGSVQVKCSCTQSSKGAWFHQPLNPSSGFRVPTLAFTCTNLYRYDGEQFALKTIPKAGPASLAGQQPTQKGMGIWERKVRDEVSLHFALSASLDIVTLHDAFEDESGIHLLIDLCDGGDLLMGASRAHTTEDEENALENQFTPDDEAPASDDTKGRAPIGESWQPFSEATAAPMIRAMLRALAACHEHGVVHRDVKPANFLFMKEPDGSRRLKLSDFGLAARIHARDETLTEQCGTYAYLSPEMARRRPYDFKVDAWAAGVVAYMLLAGEPPFADWDAIREGREPGKDGLLRNIRRGRPENPIQDLPNLSPGAKSLLSSLLQLDSTKRISCADAAEHYWVREKGVASHADALASTVVERLQAYGTLGAVRRASIRAAYETSVADGKSGAPNATARLVEAVDNAAREACSDDEGCEVGYDDDDEVPKGVSSEALMLALRDHGAELAPSEWLSLIRPVAGRATAGKKGSFVDNAALAAMLQTPAGGSFSTHVDGMYDGVSSLAGAAGVGAASEAARGAASEAAAAENAKGDGSSSSSYDWNAIAKASFERILEKSKAKTEEACEADEEAEECKIEGLFDETVTFEDVADEVCAWDGSEELCRATLKEEFEQVDTTGSGKLNVSEWTDMVWNEGFMDASGRVKSACGADAPAHHPDGPIVAGVGEPGCELQLEPVRPPTELSPREKAKAAAAARKKMSEQRAAAKAAKRAAQEQQ